MLYRAVSRYFSFMLTPRECQPPLEWLSHYFRRVDGADCLGTVWGCILSYRPSLINTQVVFVVLVGSIKPKARAFPLNELQSYLVVILASNTCQ